MPPSQDRDPFDEQMAVVIAAIRGEVGRLVGRQDIEGRVQEVLLRILRRLEDETVRDWTAFAKAIAERHCRAWHARRYAEPETRHLGDTDLLIPDGERGDDPPGEQDWLDLQASLLPQFTPNQRNIIERLARGLSIREIARQLGSQPRDVRRTVGAIAPRIEAFFKKRRGDEP